MSIDGSSQYEQREAQKEPSEIGHGNPDPAANYREETIWLYGIDNLETNRSPKEQIYFALAQAEKNPDKSSEILDSLVSSSSNEATLATGARVRTEDMLASYDALCLRVKVLDALHKTSADSEILRKNKDRIEKFLLSKEVNISDEERSLRLDNLEKASQKYFKGIEPAKLSDKYKRMARRASMLEAYVGEAAQSEINDIVAEMEKYPQDTDQFARAMVEESTDNDEKSIRIQTDPSTTSTESQSEKESSTKVVELTLDQADLQKIYEGDDSARERAIVALRALIVQSGLSSDALLFRGIHHPKSTQSLQLLTQYGTDRFVGYGPGVLPKSTENLRPFKNKGETQSLTADTYAAPDLDLAFRAYALAQSQEQAADENSFLLCYDKSALSASKYPGDQRSGELWRGYFQGEPRDALKLVVQIKVR